MSSTRSRRGPGQPRADAEETHRADSEVTTCGTTGMPPSARVLFAVVGADGTLVRGLGAASSARLATGMYQVTFDQDVTRAGYLGTLGRVDNLGVSRVGDIAVAGRTGIPNGVFVETFAEDGNRADRAFHLAVLA
ncbi:hypothetical protein [Micromonospora mirobrigensis]|uniref:Uncharacterized protein n=1 Tax=Micromonospora mirobrigensis TaxID=262898 RepID=A0A1C4UAX2_9ACTN|nr:hypothetical protein [Micromonospora mirobrigensis]SCE68850.1 hypothetical protein GA0070564_101349 [Micromonospora mirobrigensis]